LLSALFSFQANAATPLTTVACVEGVEPLVLPVGYSATGCSIDILGDTDTFSFTATAGDLIRVRMADGNGNAFQSLTDRIQVFDATGTEIGNAINELDAVLDITVPSAGTYLILASDASGDWIGNYSLHLQRLNNPGTVTPIAFGGTVNGSIGMLAEMDAYSFTATAGDLIRVRMADGNGNAFQSLTDRIQVFDATGTEIGNAINELDAVLDVTVPSTGTYLILASDASGDWTGNYMITLECMGISCGIASPVMTNPGPQSNTEGDTVALAIVATGTGTLTYSARGLAAGLTIDPNTGVISGTLGFATAGSYVVTVTVDDGTNTPVPVTFSWSIADNNRPPTVITPTAQINNEGETVILQISANDLDGDALSYSATGLPAGITIDPLSGLISGVLKYNTAGAYSVVVTVNDGTNADVSTDPFTWTVNDVPPPVLEVSTAAIDFGDVTVGSTAYNSITIGNPGSSSLVVSDIQSTDASFTVYPPTSFIIDVGGSVRTVSLGFSPGSEGIFSAIISISNNLGDLVTVNVTGRGVAVLAPGDIDMRDGLEFGRIEVPETVEQVLTITNTGAGPLTVTGATSDAPAFAVSPLVGDAYPLRLEPTATRNLLVRFSPASGSEGTTIAGVISIYSDDPDEGVRSVAVTGDAIPQGSPVVNNPVLGAHIQQDVNVYDLITAGSCINVYGQVQFGTDASIADTFSVTLLDQHGVTVVSSAFPSPAGSGLADFYGIDACGLADGVISVDVTLNHNGVALPVASGTPAAKNTSPLGAPVLSPLDPVSLVPTIPVCGTSRENTTVRVEGGAHTVSTVLDAATTSFCLDVPLQRNKENTLIPSAIGDLDGLPKPVACAKPESVVHLDPSEIVFVDVSSRPLSPAEIDALVANGVINTNEAANFNVSMFTVVMTIGSFPVTITQPVVLDPTPGIPSYGRPLSGGGGWFVGGGGGSGGPSSASGTPGGCLVGCTQLVVVPTPDGRVIPGVIIIDGRIKTLKEFFQVTLLMANTSSSFTLSNMGASISLPSGLSPVRAGVGTNVLDINITGAIDSVLIGDIAPGGTGAGQFIIRGDGVGVHNVDLNFDGFITGGGLPNQYPVSGSASTSVRVLGAPALDVVVRHPSNPNGPDVTFNEIYDLIFEITNQSDRPALYPSLELFVGGDALLVDEFGNPVSQSSKITSFGHIQPGETVSAAFRVQSLVEGEIIACQGISAESITLSIDTGPAGTACQISNTFPANFVPLDPNQPPVVIGINPLNGATNIPITTSIVAVLTPQTECLTADSWTNVVVTNIDPADPTKGLQVVSADLVQAGTYYLEELDAFGNPVRHIPTDLTIAYPPAGGTTIAVLRLGLDAPHPNSQFFLSPNTTYRVTILGGVGGACSIASGREMANTYVWTFNTAGQNLPPANNAPVAVNDSYSTNEDTPLTVAAPGVLGNDSDIDGNPLTAVLVSGPGNGTLTLNSDGSFSYTPVANFNGSDSFTYVANDGLADSNIATVTIAVNPVNDAPVANGDSYSTNEDTPLTVASLGVLANDSDIDGDPLTARLVSGPGNGTLTLNSDGSFSYTPVANFNGSDSFTYVANDGLADSNIATVTIAVSPVVPLNNAPVAVNDSYSTDEDTPLTVAAPGVLANDSDVDGNPLTAILVSGSGNGMLTLNSDGSFSYTPVANFNGSDSFTYVASDGLADSNIATVTIAVNPVNDAPVATVTTNDGNIVLGRMALVDGSQSYDPDGDALTYQWQIISGPPGSTAALTNPTLDTALLTPVLMGQYTIGLVVNDGTVDSAQDTVIINVAPNLPPIAVATGTPTTGTVPLTVDFDASGSSDPEGGVLTYAWDFGDPTDANNTSSSIYASHTYLNPGDFTAILTVTDDYGNTDQAAVVIKVTALNQPPSVSPTVTPPSGLAPLDVHFTSGAADPDGDPLTYLWDFGDGSFSTLSDPNHTYATPGVYTATVTVQDGVNLPVSASVMVSVTAVVADCSIDVEEYKLNRGRDDDVNGKVSLEVSFQCGGLPAADDLVRVVFDGVELADVRFGNFKEDKPGIYEFEGKGLHLEINFNKSRLEITRHKLRLDSVDDSNGIDVLVAFGDVTAADHVDVTKVERGENDSQHRAKGKSKESSHKKHGAH
jgi:PKD repeat protein